MWCRQKSRPWIQSVLRMSSPSVKVKCQYGPTNTYTVVTPLGDYELISCPNGIHSFEMTSTSSGDNFKADMSIDVQVKRQLYQDNGYTYKPVLQCVEWLQLYFHKSPRLQYTAKPAVCYNARKSGAFTQTVWNILADKVDYGQTVSYQELAALSGNSLASRAVGQAMRNNPISIIVPCHRVILSSGQVGNYSGGHRNGVKKWLLQHEGVLKAK